MSAFGRTLPARADLEQQKKLAKQLLAAFRGGDTEAQARVRDALPDKQRIVLADAQFVLAREYGFANWSALREQIETLARERLTPEDPSRAHERGGDGQTPLHFARSPRVADLLIAAGADLDARDVDHRSTPAEWMLGDGDDPAQSRLDLARYLVEQGASADIFLVA